MKKRLFLAIPLSDSLTAKFGGLKDKHGLEKSIRWTTKQNLHITVYFFGDIDEAKIPEMSKKIAQVTSANHQFELQYEKVRYAPPNRPARMIWADFGHSGAYDKLCNQVYEETKSFMGSAAAQAHTRDPHPHLTLARLNNPAAAKNLKLEPIPAEKMLATGCELMASELTPNGPIYTVIENYKFKL